MWVDLWGILLVNRDGGIQLWRSAWVGHPSRSIGQLLALLRIKR